MLSSNTSGFGGSIFDGGRICLWRPALLVLPLLDVFTVYLLIVRVLFPEKNASVVQYDPAPDTM
jgi:hypothetical protein